MNYLTSTTSSVKATTRCPSLPVILSAADPSQLSAIEAAIENYGGNVTFIFPDLSVLAAELPFDNIQDTSQALLNSADIEKIWLDGKVHATLSESAPLIGAPQVWDSGFRGEGVEIAILDTRVDASHPDLDDDPATDGTTDDLQGHGTHVASTAAGTGAASTGDYTGGSAWSNRLERQGSRPVWLRFHFMDHSRNRVRHQGAGRCASQR